MASKTKEMEIQEEKKNEGHQLRELFKVRVNFENMEMNVPVKKFEFQKTRKNFTSLIVSFFYICLTFKKMLVTVLDSNLNSRKTNLPIAPFCLFMELPRF